MLSYYKYSDFEPYVHRSVCGLRNNSKSNESGLDVVPITSNPQNRRLTLKNNNIKSIVASLTFYRELEALDLSQNNLSSIGRRNFVSQLALRE